MASVYSNIKKLPEYFSNISNIGIKYQKEKGSGIGVVRNARFKNRRSDDELYGGDIISNMDPTDNENNIPYYKKSYINRKRALYYLASNQEIEYIIHTLANEAVTYDGFNKFCDLKFNVNYTDEIKKKIKLNYNRIYNMLGFNDGTKAWELFVKWSIEGYLCFETIVDNIENPKEVTGFNEIDPATIFPSERIDTKTNKTVKIWVQKTTDENGSMTRREIPSNLLTFIAYNKVSGDFGHISYAERFERSFNLMRTMENTKVAWVIMNSVFRLKILVPVGHLDKTKAKQRLAIIKNKYSEDINIDHKSGQVQINSSSNFNYAKNFIMGDSDGSNTTIESLKLDGPDLSDMDIAKYFEKKLQRDSWLPFSRFDRDGGSGVFSIYSDSGVPFDEVQFHKLLKRLRTEFSKIIMNPLYFQCCLDIQVLEKDPEFKPGIGLEYQSDSDFERILRQQKDLQSKDIVSDMLSLTKPNGKQIFATEFLMKKYFEMSDVEIEENERLLELEENVNGTESREINGDMGENYQNNFDKNFEDEPQLEDSEEDLDNTEDTSNITQDDIPTQDEG